MEDEPVSFYGRGSVSDPNYVGRHRPEVIAPQQKTSKKLSLRIVSPVIAAAMLALGFGSPAHASSPTKSDMLPPPVHQTVKTTIPQPLSNIPVVHLNAKMGTNAFVAVEKVFAPPPPPPAPTPPPPPPCNWIYPPHYWGDAQWANARTIYNVGVGRGISRDGEIIALMTAMQESQLYNLGYLGANNDHDSLGLFQQRPSAGWGSPAQVTDPIYASNKFYDGLVRIANWWTLAKTWAAQDVQVSAFPYAYAKWETDATDMATNFANCPA